MVVEDSESEGISSHAITYSDGSHITGAAIASELVPHFANILAIASGGIGAEKLDRDSLMLLAASEIGADVLVTAREALLAARTLDTPNAITIASPAQATSILGLYIRSRGEFFATKSAQFAFTYNKGLYWQKATELYIPSLPDVTARTVQLVHARGNPALGLLAMAVQRRLARIFERRDGIWRLINQDQHRDIAEDTLTAIDALLTFLMSASDALAKVADGVLITDIDRAYVAWQKKDWLKAITKKDAALGALFDASGHSAGAMKVLRLLRNCIHDKGLDAVAVRTSQRVRETWIVLPASQAAAITGAMIRLRPLADWGVHEGPDGSRYVEAGPLVETLLLETLAALSSAVERLGQVLAPMTAPPDFGSDSYVDEALLSSHIQWQGGLGDPWPTL